MLDMTATEGIIITMYDDTWNIYRLGVANEDSFTLPLPFEWNRRIQNFLYSSARALGSYEIAIDDNVRVSGSEMNLAIKNIEELIKHVEGIFEKISNWKWALNSNERTHISGAEYWELVSSLDSIHEFMTGKIVVRLTAGSPIYYTNMKYLTEHFELYKYTELRDLMIQPLYAEVKRCRDEELALPKYQF